MLKLKPAQFFTEKMAQRITLGNFDEHFNHLAEVDWVIEAVVENLDIKRQLFWVPTFAIPRTISNYWK